ncbi:MAG: tetratricopeptide repeat protein [Bacteroidota bacterium]
MHPLDSSLLQEYASYAFAGYLGEVAQHKGLALLEFSAELLPESAQAQAALAQAYHSLGRSRRARHYLNKSLALDPNAPTALKLKAEIEG